MADFFPQVGIIQIQLVSSTKFTRSCEFPVFSENPAEFRRLQAAGKTPAAVVVEGKQLGLLLDEDPALMERRVQCAKRLELYKSARDEIEAVSWAR